MHLISLISESIIYDIFQEEMHVIVYSGWMPELH